ncbi:transcriptional regulator [Streptantibioticus cattleyicolor NRRL 8057 = DSM 46488]|uniref:Transcriptional regulator n=1 Tax=Streptantibioticus cattleyicolor (strain ATCC 35852 / DSM 46488 / JCM 4925 / NBRC 14057 / NRRL 8057) TaxID=1003195 RepID=F8JQ53_STREN|nr:transcriptional regulator [Streptantibioticus cattleyicolor NRRL 8057 = DSM 46488]MYS59898.1 cyclic nucleotide-binding domain-containing protein [Streptomyces sp. SID5468]CCB75661.1 Transcriptional regulator [Streptantibioticus cattleyicolor NRRL 8057 = DSM 46488]
MRRLVGDAVWTAMLAHTYERRHPAGITLLRQGQPGTHVLVLRGGVAKVIRHERDGGLTLLAFRGPGELLGEVAVLDDGVRSASVRTISHCSVGVMSKADFLRFVTEHSLFPVLVRYALTKLRESDLARGGGDVPTRLAAALAYLADICEPSTPSPGQPLELALTRDELAQYLATSRNTITAALCQLEPFQVRAGRKRIVIEDLPALRRAAADHRNAL